MLRFARNDGKNGCWVNPYITANINYIEILKQVQNDIGKLIMISAIDHINIVVSDMERSVKFYTEVLGLEKIGSVHLEGDWIDEIAGLKGVIADSVNVATPEGDVKIELFCFKTPEGETIPANKLSNTVGVRHIGLRVDDIHATYKKLKDAGVNPLSEPVTIPDSVIPNNPVRKTMFYFLGPDNVLLEVAELKRV